MPAPPTWAWCVRRSAWRSATDRVVSIAGGSQAREVERSLTATTHEGSYVIAELGIGLNPAGLLRGQIVEDEGVYGTGHIALGNNTNFVGGTNWAPIHFDYVFLEPTVMLDGRTVMTAGQLVDAIVRDGSELACHAFRRADRAEDDA